MMIEQPLGWDDLYGHVELQKKLDTPICLDECIHTAEQARAAIELRACKIINIKLGRVGGYTVARHIHDLCQQNGIPVWCGGMLESGIGRAHNIALSTLPNFTLPGDVTASKRYWARRHHRARGHRLAARHDHRAHRTRYRLRTAPRSHRKIHRSHRASGLTGVRRIIRRTCPKPHHHRRLDRSRHRPAGPSTSSPQNRRALVPSCDGVVPGGTRRRGMVPTYLSARDSTHLRKRETRRRELHRRDLWTFLYLGFFGVTRQSDVLHHRVAPTSVSHSSVIVGMGPIYTLGFAVLFALKTQPAQSHRYGDRTSPESRDRVRTRPYRTSSLFASDAITRRSIGFATYTVLGRR